jgi:LysM repeat protein
MKLDLWTEKRQYPRASLNWPVTLISNDGTTILGRVKDMSRGGVLVHVETILKIDKQVRLAIEIPEVDDVVSAIGKITRTRVLDEQNSSFTHGLSIRFTKISVEDCKYFSGNLAPEWRNTDTGDGHSTRQITANKVDNTSKNRNKSPWLIIGVVAGVGLLLAATVFFQSFRQKTPVETEEAVLRKEVLQLFEHTDDQIASMRQSQQQMTVSITQIDRQVSDLKDSAIPSGQIDEIRALLEVLTRELNQIKIDSKKQAAQTKAAVTVPPKKTAEDKQPLEYHTVRRGETIYQISKRYGLTVEKLLRLNSLGRGTIIYSNQKLRIQ